VPTIDVIVRLDRTIQYAAPFQMITGRLRLLDRTLSRAMTTRKRA
jgi:hypothetical protein